jgi:hypothetical protein
VIAVRLPCPVQHKQHQNITGNVPEEASAVKKFQKLHFFVSLVIPLSLAW